VETVVDIARTQKKIYTKRKHTMEKELLSNIVQMQGQLKVLHWQTESFAEHNAFEITYESISKLFDKLIEVYSGKYQRPKFGGVKELSFADYSNLKVDAFIEGMDEFMANAFMAEQDSELANIRDEIRADLMKLKYLLTLK
jgi:hypothetical protein